MPVITKYSVLLMLLLSLCTGAVYGQTGFFIPQKGKVYFAGDTATIFSNVTNQGQLGINKGAVVNFKAKQWQNDAQATITDESNNGNGTTGKGGTVRFITPDTTVAYQQTLIGGYNAVTKAGASFPNLTVANSYGILLKDASTKIRRQLDFADGHIHAEDNIIVVGNGNPGIISGYNENRFVVTGSSVTGGFLLREKIGAADGWVTFPVGTAEGLYTPAALKANSGTADDFYARVSDGVKSDVTTGQDLANKSVNKTWQIGKLLYPGSGAVDIDLQHLLSDEGVDFVANRNNSYLSQYIKAGWDTSYPKTTPQAGILTTGSPLANSATNTRVFTNTVISNSFFTKFAGKETLKTKLLFSAYRKDRNNVWVYWSTNPEINESYFIVQRRLNNESVFTNRDSVNSKALTGASFSELDYGVNDPNSYTGVSFYRLMMISYGGDTTYSNIVAIGGKPGGFGTVLWPNPSTGRFYIGISMMGVVKSVNIYNDIGQLLHYEMVNNRGYIEMYLRTPGAYMVSFISYDGSVLETKKLIITGH